MPSHPGVYAQNIFSKSMWWFILALLLVGLLCVLRSVSSYTDHVQIPKIIWTYWDSEDLPEMVRKSIENWKHYSPNYDVRVVTPKTLPVYLPEKDFSEFWKGDVVQRQADLIRLYLLSKYGGVWSDASIAVKKPHDDIIGTDREFMGYYREAFTNNMNRPIIENWFFATVPNSEFVTRWRDEFERSAKFSTVQEYLEDAKKRGGNFQKMSQSNAEYMTPYISAQVVLSSMDPEDIQRTMKLEKSDDGPFKHSTRSDWDPKKAMEWLCTTNDLPDMIKVYGNERREVEGDDSLKCMYKIFD